MLNPHPVRGIGLRGREGGRVSPSRRQELICPELLHATPQPVIMMRLIILFEGLHRRMPPRNSYPDLTSAHPLQPGPTPASGRRDVHTARSNALPGHHPPSRITTTVGTAGTAAADAAPGGVIPLASRRCVGAARSTLAGNGRL